MIREERALLERIVQTNRLHGLFREGDRLLIALSGGPDSAALAALLSSLRAARRLDLHALHINHKLSPHAASFEPAAKSCAGRLRVPLRIHKVDVGALAKRRKISIEEAGREARYGAFVQEVKRIRATAVATAHTRDDQVETVLFRIFRGTSLQGLSGVPYVRTEKNIRIIRPLLDCEKRDLESFVSHSKIPFRRDPSNRSPQHRRNRIRHELLPLVEKRLNPQVRHAVANLQRSWAETAPIVALAVDAAWKACGPQRRAAALSLDRKAFTGLADALRQEVFVRAVETLGGGRSQLGRAHIESARSLAEKGGREHMHFPGFTVKAGAKRLVWRLKRVR